MRKQRTLTPLVLAMLLVLGACQQPQTTQQYFEEAPEIEIAKKAVHAFQDGDLDTYRQCYADTALFWHNVLFTGPGKTLEEQLRFVESIYEAQEYYRYEDEIWEMIIQNNGTNYVHLWATFITRYKGDDQEIQVPLHFAFSLADNKIVVEGGIWNALPFYLAEQRLAAQAGQE